MAAFNAKRVATASYNKLMSKISALYKILITRDNSVALLADGFDSIHSIDWPTKALGLQEGPGINGDERLTAKEQSMTVLKEMSGEDDE